ncbi:MAG: 2,3-bisphosphoglycerate-dependent phosphoglycerate mutase, partial [Gammaproteobacteria bacterium]
RMTGWSDVDLNARGREQARVAGRLLLEAGYEFDVAFTSWLRRAEETLEIMLAEMDQRALPVQRSWRLNERHYGMMQGMSRQQAVREFGLRQFATCQSGYAQPPPPVAEDDPRFPGNDPRYAHVPAAALPRGESMEDTLQRVLPCWEEDIVPALRAGKRVLIVAHKTSVRVIRKQLEGISDEQICSLTIETGKPIAYQLDESLAVRAQRSLIPSGRVKRLAQAALARWVHGNRSGDRA